MNESNVIEIVSVLKSFFLFCFFTSEAKEQVLANLANFAYDPKNMDHLRQLQVSDLFLDMLTEDNQNFVEFGMGECRTNKSFNSSSLPSFLAFLTSVCVCVCVWRPLRGAV